MKELSTQCVWALVAISAGSLFAAEPPQPAAALATNSAPAVPLAPKIQFASTLYDFGKVMAGQVVKYDFFFTNTGNCTLELSGVYPSCGCTTAGDWTHKVEPGATGVVPLAFDSERFAGQTVTKTATVVCNAKNQPSLMLQMRGSVWRPIEITPPTAILSVISGSASNATALVHIISSLDQPITLSEPQCSNRAFTATLKTIRPGKEFQLTIQTAAPLQQGNTSGTITMRTSSTNIPIISVTTLAIVQAAMAAMPMQVNLPRFQTNAFPYTVFIRNNSPGAVTVSNPAINIDGVGLQLREQSPGRQFSVTMTFPAGFEIPPNKQVALTVKTSHPQFPEISIPVRQVAAQMHVVPISKLPKSPTTPTAVERPSPPAGTR